MKNNIDIDKIERYLDGQMNAVEQEAFETLIAAQPDLAQEVQFHKNLIKGMKIDQPDIDKAQLKNIWDALKDGERPRSTSLRLRPLLLYAAAAIIGLVVLANLLLQPASSTPIAETSYFEPYPVIITRATRSPAENQLLTEAKQAYIQKDYESASLLFDSLTVQAPDEEGMLLYSGISYYQMEYFGEAAQRFQQLLSQSETWDEHARWYLALTYLKQDKRTQTKVLLEEINTYERHFNLEKAKLLLQDLESF